MKSMLASGLYRETLRRHAYTFLAVGFSSRQQQAEPPPSPDEHKTVTGLASYPWLMRWRWLFAVSASRLGEGPLLATRVSRRGLRSLLSRRVRAACRNTRLMAVPPWRSREMSRFRFKNLLGLAATTLSCRLSIATKTIGSRKMCRGKHARDVS